MTDNIENSATPQPAAETKTAVFSIPKPAETVKLEPETIIGLHRLANVFERMNLVDYLAYLKRPRSILWVNFLVGLARGLGFAIGMTFLFAIVLYLLGRMVDLPLIGQFIAKIVDIVNEEVTRP